jgi:DNA gyrase subunit A
VLGLVKEELAEIVEAYGDERRTEIAHFEGDVGIEDMIADQQMVISLTASATSSGCRSRPTASSTAAASA